MTTKVAIEIKNVCLVIKQQHVLENISVNFQYGEIASIIGRNGSGKSMLLKVIIGLVPIDSGEIWVAGKNVRTHEGFAPNTRFLLNESGFLPQLSGHKNLELLAKFDHTMNNDKIDEAMRKVGLNPKDQKPISKYSRGMIKRLGIAQAIMENAKVLILDEPFNGIDEETIPLIQQLLRDLANDGCAIVVTKDLQNGRRSFVS